MEVWWREKPQETPLAKDAKAEGMICRHFILNFAGGDRRSNGRADELAADVLAGKIDADGSS